MNWKRWAKRTFLAVLGCLALQLTWDLGKREYFRSKGEERFAAAETQADSLDPNWRWDELNAARRIHPMRRTGRNSSPKSSRSCRRNGTLTCVTMR